MSEQDGTQFTTLPRPTNGDKERWKAYWKAQGQEWRTEPEIDDERQKYLTERRNIKPDIEKGIYPFKDIKMSLSRADIEWLLATHESGNMHGPVDWNDEKQRKREGLDMRGADLSRIDLCQLPLARLRGGLTWNERPSFTEEQRYMAVVLMKNADLYNAHLEGANLGDAQLEEAVLERAQLKEAVLIGAHLERAHMGGAHLEQSLLMEAYLEKADLRSIHLGDEKQKSPLMADIHWNDTNLAVVKWSQIEMLGDEYEASQKTHNGKVKSREIRLEENDQAVRANRQLAIALQTQGLNEDAARFAYRAQVLQKRVYRFQILQHGVKFRQRRGMLGAWFFSWFLFLLAGYGYRPGRSVLWYLAVVFGFAVAYFSFGHLPFLPDALVFSLTSFHGRGFFPGLGSENSLHNPLVVLAASEAVIGLFIEISFIATFTKRFFGS